MPNQIKDFLHSSGKKKWPSKKQWGQLFKVLTKREKIAFSLFLILAVFSFFTLIFNFYCRNTQIKPAEGGTYIEGVIGSPMFINPIYSSDNDVDRDLVEFIFSGLMKYNGDGKIINDLAQDYKIEEDGTSYIVYLKNDIFWEDGEKITADDVIFTVKKIQDPDCRSPLIKYWLGIKVEKISDNTIRFKLEKPYGPFIENLTLKIIPQHVWKDISSKNFRDTELNLNPVGSGPYKLDQMKRDEKTGEKKSLTLIPNEKYFGNKPYISKFVFLFFKNEAELIESASHKEIKGLSISSPKNISFLKELGLKDYHFQLSRYFSVFFNQNKSKLLSEKEIRKALACGTNKEELLEKVLGNQGKIVDSPILPDIFGFNKPSEIYLFNEALANETLEKTGFIKNESGLREKSIKKEPAFQLKSNLILGSSGNEVTELQKCLARDPEIYPSGEATGYFGQKTKDAVIKFQEKYRDEILTPQQLGQGTGEVKKSTRDKLNSICFGGIEEKTPLSFSLVTVNQQELIDTANLLKNQWQKIGIETEVKIFDISTAEQWDKFKKEIINSRNYDMLLFGEFLGLIPDPFPFWHSSQKKDPGSNLALFENKDCDKLLESARQTIDENERKKDLESFQNLLIKEVPAVFLYNPDYLYLISEEVRGINEKIITDPSNRFSEVENWYINTKRTW